MATTSRVDSRDAAFQIATELSRQFGEEAADRDRERRFPHDEMHAFKTSGLAAMCLPVECGGVGATYGDSCRVLEIIAQGDPSIAQMGLVHIHGHEVFGSVAKPDIRRELDERLARGELWWTNAHSERHGKDILDYKLTIQRDGEDWVINGSKFYCTGSLAGDMLYVNGLNPATSDWRMAFVPMDAEGLIVHDDWDAMGQATTASGTIDFQNVHVPDEHIAEVDLVLSLGGDDSLVSGVLPQCMFGAILVGIAKTALHDTISYVRERSRPWIHSGVDRSADDPYVLLRVGEMFTRVETAELVLRQAMEVLDEAQANPSPERRGHAAVRAAQIKSYASQVAIDAGELLFKVCGASSTLRKYDYDRHWRNARTLSLHDPADYKTKIVAQWAVNEAFPPVTMYT